MAETPVVAAIPNYNMGDSLNELLPQILSQDYNAVFVLDDASTDHSVDVVRSYRSEVTLLRHNENKGAAATRNLVLEGLGREAILHFIDADMELETKQIPEKARNLIGKEAVGFVGGLVKNPDGRQMGFNYGPRQCLRTDLLSMLQSFMCNIGASNPQDEFFARRNLGSLLDAWPDPTMPPASTQTYWVSEANMFMRSDVLTAVGGFDSKLRYHEIQDLAIRLDKRGLARFFDPLVAATHKAINVRGHERKHSMARSEFLIARKHGFRNYFLPDGHWKPSLER